MRWVAVALVVMCGCWSTKSYVLPLQSNPAGQACFERCRQGSDDKEFACARHCEGVHEVADCPRDYRPPAGVCYRHKELRVGWTALIVGAGILAVTGFFLGGSI